MARPRTVADETILAAAAEAVAAAGPANVTLAQIGGRVGLTAAALMRRFGSKDRLLLALARHDAEALPARLAGAESAEQPVHALIEALAAMAGAVRSTTEFANHLAFLLLDMSDPRFQQVSREYTVAVEAAIGVVLRAGRAAGELRAGADDEGLPRAVHAAYNGALVTWGMAGGDEEPAAYVQKQLLFVLGSRLSRSVDRADQPPG
ncbi:TetR/AcrR family transcriptional regulator [Actinoplanes palleronii]|nr:TetR/AcrR family transcriptional regulator [Actinoplanes palleronii]